MAEEIQIESIEINSVISNTQPLKYINGSKNNDNTVMNYIESYDDLIVESNLEDKVKLNDIISEDQDKILNNDKEKHTFDTYENKTECIKEHETLSCSEKELNNNGIDHYYKSESLELIIKNVVQENNNEYAAGTESIKSETKTDIGERKKDTNVSFALKLAKFEKPSDPAQKYPTSYPHIRTNSQVNYYNDKILIKKDNTNLYALKKNYQNIDVTLSNNAVKEKDVNAYKSTVDNVKNIEYNIIKPSTNEKDNKVEKIKRIKDILEGFERNNNKINNHSNDNKLRNENKSINYKFVNKIERENNIEDVKKSFAEKSLTVNQNNEKQSSTIKKDKSDLLIKQDIILTSMNTQLNHNTSETSNVKLRIKTPKVQELAKRYTICSDNDMILKEYEKSSNSCRYEPVRKSSSAVEINIKVKDIAKEFGSQKEEVKKSTVNFKELPKNRSVFEKIVLFEEKTKPSTNQSKNYKTEDIDLESIPKDQIDVQNKDVSISNKESFDKKYIKSIFKPRNNDIKNVMKIFEPQENVNNISQTESVIRKVKLKPDLKENDAELKNLEKSNHVFKNELRNKKVIFSLNKTAKSTGSDIESNKYVDKDEEKSNYINLADGTKMPLLSIGTALLGESTKSVVASAIKLGYRGIDTAFIYGNEKEVGDAIKEAIQQGVVKREDLFITAKLWSTFHRPDLVEKACRDTIEKLGVEYIDLYLIHNPMSFKEGQSPIPKIAKVIQYSQSDYLDAWRGMEGLVNKNLVRSIGVSNFNSQQLGRVIEKGKIKPVVNQVECHPYLTQERLHHFCKKHQIVLFSYGCLGSKGTPEEYKNKGSTPVIDDQTVLKMAERLGCSPAQVLIKYQLERSHPVVIKASSSDHLNDNLRSLNLKLSQEDINELKLLNKNRRNFSFKGMGDTHKNYPFNISY